MDNGRTVSGRSGVVEETSVTSGTCIALLALARSWTGVMEAAGVQLEAAFTSGSLGAGAFAFCSHASSARLFGGKVKGHRFRILMKVAKCFSMKALCSFVFATQTPRQPDTSLSINTPCMSNPAPGEMATMTLKPKTWMSSLIKSWWCSRGNGIILSELRDWSVSMFAELSSPHCRPHHSDSGISYRAPRASSLVTCLLYTSPSPRD